jgi:signal transduction histidine kinase
VCDDGRGFDPTTRRGVGLNVVVVGALEEIGAQVRIESSRGNGTLVEITGGYEWRTDLGSESSSSMIRR